MRLVLASLVLLFAGCSLQPVFADGPLGVTTYVTTTGCEPSGACPYGRGGANYYDPTTRVIVLYPNQSPRVVAHEGCHVHQHEVVLAETGREPTRDLREWYDTAEGRLYTAATAGLAPIPGWPMSADSALEDFANACAYRRLGYPLDDARRTLMEVLLGP